MCFAAAASPFCGAPPEATIELHLFGVRPYLKRDRHEDIQHSQQLVATIPIAPHVPCFWLRGLISKSYTEKTQIHVTKWCLLFLLNTSPPRL